MMNKKILALILSGAFLMSGCSLMNRTPAPDLPAGAPSFTQDSNGTGEAVINYNGREYAFFGTLKNSMSNDSLRECIGYVGDDENERIYTLMEDTFDNYIMVKNTNGVMDQPGFYRATDTKNENILTPSYIESLGYESWGSSGLHYEERTAVIGVVCEADNVIEIDYSIDINGENANIGGVRYGNMGVLKHGDLLTIEILERSVIKHAEPDKPFNVRVTLSVIQKDGQTVEVNGEFTHDMMLGGYFRQLEVHYSEAEGYYLVVN